MTEAEERGMREFLEGFSAALKIVGAGTEETRVHLWGVAEGKDFILTVRQATKKDFEERGPSNMRAEGVKL